MKFYLFLLLCIIIGLFILPIKASACAGPTYDVTQYTGDRSCNNCYQTNSNPKYVDTEVCFADGYTRYRGYVGNDCSCEGGGGGGGGDNPKGFHDESRCDLSYGWACDASDYNQPLEIKLYADGSSTPFATTTANKWSEQGVVDSCGGTGNHRFDVATPNSLKDGNTHSIVARATNVGAGGDADLSGTPKQIQCAPPPSGTISASPNPCSISGLGATTCTSNITWATANTGSATVCVNSGTGENIFASGLNGTQAANWIQANKNYVFTLRNGGDCTGTILASTTVTASCPALSAPPAPTYTCSNNLGTAAILNLPNTNATKYLIRVADGAPYDGPTIFHKTVFTSPLSNTPGCGTGIEPDVCIDSYTSSSLGIVFSPDRPYGWWIHAADACGHVSAATGGPVISCPTFTVTFKDPANNPMPQQFSIWNSVCTAAAPGSGIATINNCGSPTPTADCTAHIPYPVPYACVWARIMSGNPVQNHILGITPAGYSSLLNTSAGDLYGWPKWDFGQKVLNFIVDPPACTTVAFSNYNNLSAPTVNQINYAYSDRLTGVTKDATSVKTCDVTCEATVSGCGASIDINGQYNPNHTQCYVSEDWDHPNDTTYCRARVDFKPSVKQACDVIFKLHPPALPQGDTCPGTSAPACTAVDGSCSSSTSYSCNGNNKVTTITRTYTNPSCGGNSVPSCITTNDYPGATCNDGNTCTDDTCSAGGCVFTNNFGVCPAFMKINGGDVHANKKTSQ